MKKTFRYIALGAAVALAAVSCKKDEIDMYAVEDCAVVFKTPSFSFSLKGVTEETLTVSIPVTLVGPVTDYDREVAVDILDSETSNAASGTDFRILHAVLPAGQYTGEIAVEIVNNLDETVPRRQMSMQLVPNEFFRAGDPRHSGAEVVWSEEYVRPKEGVWRYWFLFFSRYYSRNLHEFLVTEFGEEIELVTNSNSYVREDESLIYRLPSWWYAASRQLRDAVRAYDEAHPDAPLMHSADCMYYSGYNVAAGAGMVPETLPTVYETLNVF